MIRIAAIVLLNIIATLPAHAAEDNAPQNPDKDAVSRSVGGGDYSADKLSMFSLWQPNNKFSLYGKLSFHAVPGDAKAETQQRAATYGLHGQLDSMSKIGIHFGWDRYMAGQNASDNLYSLTATFKF